jgi:hypothetical protein
VYSVGSYYIVISSQCTVQKYVKFSGRILLVTFSGNYLGRLLTLLCGGKNKSNKMLNNTQPTLQLHSECKIFLIAAFTEYIVLHHINRGYIKFLRKLTVTKVVNSFHETYIFINVSVEVPP